MLHRDRRTEARSLVMICSNCGNNNTEGYKFCTKCGAKLEVKEPSVELEFENDETVILDDTMAFENDETVILDDISVFENDETVILDDITAFENDEIVILDDISSFENDETVILDNSPDPIKEIEDDGTVILNDDKNGGSGKAETSSAIPKAPVFDYRPVYKENGSCGSNDTGYIDHLRALKGLLDDGIITEEEFTHKKKQILGL